MLFFQFTGPAVVNSLGKAFLESVTSPLAGPVTVADNGTITAGLQSTTALYHLRVRQTFEDKRRSTLDAMAFSASVGVTAHLDETLFPTPGPLTPNQALSNLDQYTMYNPWLSLHREGKTIVRLQMNFLQNQNDPALPELRERLRNQFQFFGDPMMMTGRDRRVGCADRLGRRLARGAAARRPVPVAQRERGRLSRPAATGGRGLRGGRPGVRHQGPALDGPSRAVRQQRPAHAAQEPRRRRRRWRRSAGSAPRRTRPRRWARRSGPSSTTASRSASTATACTSRRSTRGCTSIT